MSDQYENQDATSGKSKTVENGSKMPEETTSKVKKVAVGVAHNLMKEVDLDEMMLELADKLAGTGAEQGNM